MSELITCQICGKRHISFVEHVCPAKLPTQFKQCHSCGGICGGGYDGKPCKYQNVDHRKQPVYTVADMDKAMNEVLLKVSDLFSHLHGDEKVKIGYVWDQINSLRSKEE